MCRQNDDQHLEDLERRSGCFDEEEEQDPPEEPDQDQLVHEEQMLTADASTGQDFEQQPSQHDNRASGWIARHDPEAMESYIITDQAKALIFKVCDAAHVVPPNPISMGSAVELIRGLTEFNAEQMLTRSLTANGLDITLLRRRRLEFDRNVAA